MINFKTTARAGAIAVGAMLGATVYTSQAEAVLVTLDPAGSSPILQGVPQFNADNATIASNATVTFDGAGNFVEQGFFRITSFNIGGNPQASGVGAGSYNIYGTFVATGSQAGPIGIVNSLTFTLFGDPNGDTDFPIAGLTLGNLGDDFQLASGSIVGVGSALIIPELGGDGDPEGLALNATTTFVVAPGQEGFFVAPVPFNINLEIAATVTDQASSTTCGNGPFINCSITVNGGGGNISFLAVPEPATLGLLGTGLLAIGGAVRRRRARA